MVLIWPQMACIPMFLSYTTYTSHIHSHIVSDGPQIAWNWWFLGNILPPRLLKMTITKPFLAACSLEIARRTQSLNFFGLKSLQSFFFQARIYLLIWILDQELAQLETKLGFSWHIWKEYIPFIVTHQVNATGEQNHIIWKSEDTIIWWWQSHHPY